MEAAILGGIIREVITSLGSHAYNQIARCVGVEDEIRKLERSLRNIQDQIRDADGYIAGSEATDDDLKTLTDFVHEAASIIDRFNIEMAMLHTSQLQEWRPLSVCSCCREVGIRHQAANDIEKLNKRLEVVRMPSDSVLRSPRVGQAQVEGPREDEQNLMVGSAISNDCQDLIRRVHPNGGGRALFAIVGEPGVGKTALARKIYHDRSWRSWTRLWVHRPSGTGSLTIWSGDQREPTAPTEEMARQMDDIESRLSNTNHLLLVIDNVRDKDNWNFLGNREDEFIRRHVRVIITTSHKDITRMIAGTADREPYYHHVKTLGDDDSWLLLLKAARLPEHSHAVMDVQDVGRRIVQKCSGLPMALKAVGYRLRSYDRAAQWESVHNTDFVLRYDEIRWCIDASYMELNYRQKQCFLYCSLYPEGSVIEQRHIMQQWIAEGFYREDQEARDCFKELVKRSLLVRNKYNGADGASGGGATMLPLLRSYAVFRSQNEKVRRHCVADDDLPEDTNLKTLMVHGSSSPQGGTDTVTSPTPPLMHRICEKFKSLRVLDLRDTQVRTVGGNLKKLLQLRYLNLSNTLITTLPAEIGNLVVLQFLILKNCSCLTALPREVGLLKNLRSLDISGTPSLENVRFNLAGFREVNCFRGLFSPVSSNDEWGLMNLSHMTNLTSLQIDKLSTSTSLEAATQLNLQGSSLKELELRCTATAPVGQGPDDQQDADHGGEGIRRILDELMPPRDLTSLKLAGFYGSSLPSWLLVRPSHLTVLQRLTLDGCSHYQQLPRLGEMAHLKFLALIGPNASLSEIGNDLRGVPRNGTAFPQLQQLIVREMSILENWLGFQQGDMPRLRCLELSGCLRLNGLPPWLRHCTALTALKTQRCGLREIRNLHALNELQVDSCDQLHTIGRHLDRLEDLKIAGCTSLTNLHGFRHLRSLRVVQEEGVRDLPLWLQPNYLRFTLTRLEIGGGQELLDRCYAGISPNELIIRGVAEHVRAILPDGSTYYTYMKSTGRFSPRSRQPDQGGADAEVDAGARINVHDVVAMPVPQLGTRGRRDAWMSYTLYTLYAVILVASQWFVLRIAGARS
ncbi:hypothetical protein ACP4OV_023830 [Aristida adscensionis]